MGIIETIGIVTTRAMLAFIVFTLAVFAASLTKSIVKKSLKKLRLNQTLALLNYPYDLEGIVATTSFYFVYLLFIALSFWLLGIASIVAILLLATLLMVISLSIFSFAKDFIPNVLGFLRAKYSLDVVVGSKVDLPKVSGTVKEIGFINTRLILPSGDLVYVPNILFWHK